MTRCLHFGFHPLSPPRKVPNGPMTSLANPMAVGSLRRGQPARREFVLDAPSSSAEKRFRAVNRASARPPIPALFPPNPNPYNIIPTS